MTIAFNEIDTTSLLPGVFAEIDLTAGAPGVTGQVRKVWIMGERVSAGTSSDNEIRNTPFESWAKADEWFGAGSVGSYMAARAIQTMVAMTGRRPAICGIALPDAGGTKAQGKFVASGTASSAGYAIVRIEGVTFTVQIANGSTPQNTTDAILAKWNEIDTWLKPPVTVTSVIDGAGPDYMNVVEGNNTGAHFNTLQIEVIEFTPGTQTLAVDAATLGTKQAGVGDVTLTTVLGNMAAVRTHYIAFSDFITGTTTTGLTALKNHIKAKADGNTMLAGYVFSGHVGTLSAATTVASGVDSSDAERMVLAWHENSKTWNAGIAASQAMVQAMQVDPTRPVNNVVHPAMVAQAVSSRPTDTSCNTALAGGVTPLRTLDGDEVNPTTVRLVSMRTDLIEPFDLGILETYDEFRDRGVARCTTRFINFKIKENAEEVFTSKCTTPDGVKGEWVGVALEMEEEDKLQNVEDNANNAVAEYLSGGGCALEFPAQYVPGLHRIMTKIKAVYS